MGKLLTFEILNLGTNNLVVYLLKPRDILFGESGQLRYDLTVVVVASVYPYQQREVLYSWTLFGPLRLL